MHTYTVSYIRSVIHTHTDTHTTCIVPLHELRYQPCAYEIVVNRLAFNSLLSIQNIRSNLFFFFFGEEVSDFSDLHLLLVCFLIFFSRGICPP